MVGTAPATVGRSDSMSFASGSAWRNRSGMTKLAPAYHAAYGSPHALAWNIGTIGSTRSCSVSPTAMPALTLIECNTVERCEYTTPFGLPVVPLV
jgi:hypothetical protein